MLKSLFDALQIESTKISPLGGEKNHVIHEEFLKPLNKARNITNQKNYQIAYHLDKKLSKEHFKASKAYLKPLSHVQLARLLKSWDLRDVYELLGFCKESSNFSSSFWWKLKQRKSGGIKKSLQQENS